MACTPCYHPRDANRVRVDGPHTLARVEEQMATFEQVRGPVAHAQLIGGEVTLLDPDDHAAALQIMRRHGREPMSMTHGDVDPAYLHRLAVGPDGRRRFRRLSFAVHIDSLMFGRRGIARPPHERSLTPYRRRFLDAVGALRRELGIRSFVAHSMTVTPANVGQVADVVRDCLALGGGGPGFGMLSFQPAAFVGDDRRWREDYRDADADAVWAEIEPAREPGSTRRCSSTATCAATASPTASPSERGGCRCSTPPTRATSPSGTPSSGASAA